MNARARSVSPDPNAVRIANAYYKAKILHPDLTQAQFAATALPSVSGKQRSPESGARYLRLILANARGKQSHYQTRTGAKIVARANIHRAEPNIYQVHVRMTNGEQRSFNVVSPEFTSQLDVFEVADSPRIPKAVEQKMTAWQIQSPPQEGAATLEMESFLVSKPRWKHGGAKFTGPVIYV